MKTNIFLPIFLVITLVSCSKKQEQNSVAENTQTTDSKEVKAEMITISAEYQQEFETFLTENSLSAFAKPIGTIIPKNDFCVEVFEAI